MLAAILLWPCKIAANFALYGVPVNDPIISSIVGLVKIPLPDPVIDTRSELLGFKTSLNFDLSLSISIKTLASGNSMLDSVLPSSPKDCAVVGPILLICFDTTVKSLKLLRVFSDNTISGLKVSDNLVIGI